MRKKSFLRSILCFALVTLLRLPHLSADSRGDELAQWINRRGREIWGAAPEKCDDLTFARRIYLDLLGRVPSIAELRDYEELGENRRFHLIEMLVFSEGERADQYKRLVAQHLARQWRQVLLPTGTAPSVSVVGIENWLAAQFLNEVPYDEWMRDLVNIKDGPRTTSRMAATGGIAAQYFQILGGLPENYAGNLSRVMLGVRIECAQCHDHPFTAWKQKDFWGLAAFYSDLGNRVAASDDKKEAATLGKIEFDKTVYSAKYLWQNEPVSQTSLAMRGQLSEWMTSKSNPNFAATAVNRFWQQLIGRGLYADVDNLDQATDEARMFANELGARFANNGFQIPRLLTAICKSDWYQAVSQNSAIDSDQFYRPLKTVGPQQVFDSMEQSLHLPISRLDPAAPRWSGERIQLVSRLSESSGRSPEEYAAGIPQALLLMNGRLTTEAVHFDSSRLLRAVLESPFFEEKDQVETLYLAVLTRKPTTNESRTINAILDSKSNEAERKQALSELLWALINSPEFVLCR